MVDELEIEIDLHAEFNLPSQHVNAVAIDIVFSVEDGWPFPDRIITDEENPLTFEDLFALSGEYQESPWHSLSDMMTWLSESCIEDMKGSLCEEPDYDKPEPSDWEP